MKRAACSQYGCSESPYLGGMCKRHHDEAALKRERRDMAIYALNTGKIGGRLPDDPELSEELQRLQKWWRRACYSVNYQKPDKVLQDEAEYAVEWCIHLAQEIVTAELALREGGSVPTSLQTTRNWVWDRFENLEAGFMSNGVGR